MSKETDLTPAPKPPMTLRDLREIAKRSEVMFNEIMSQIRAFDWKIASVNADIQRRQDSFGPIDSKKPDIVATFNKQREEARKRYWGMHEAAVRKSVGELRENATMMAETKKVLANPKAVLSMSEIGTPRRVALFQELSQMQHAALKNAAAVAVSTRDATMGGVLATINDGKNPKDRFLEPSFATDIVGHLVAEADNLIRDLEARDAWALANYQSRDRNKPLNATARIQYAMRFGPEIPKETGLTAADLPNVA